MRRRGTYAAGASWALPVRSADGDRDPGATGAGVRGVDPRTPAGGHNRQSANGRLRICRWARRRSRPALWLAPGAGVPRDERVGTARPPGSSDIVREVARRVVA